MSTVYQITPPMPADMSAKCMADVVSGGLTVLVRWLRLRRFILTESDYEPDRKRAPRD